MDPQHIREAARRFIGQLDRLEQGDPDAADDLLALFAEDAHLSNPIIERAGGERVGRDAIADFWRNYRGSFGHIHSEFYDVTAGDQSAGLFWRSKGAGPDGQALSYEGVTLLNFDDGGRITRLKGFFDRDQVRLKAAAH
jgi:ketosteroid isomerase-like protein